MFRAPTFRKYIQYRVHLHDDDEEELKAVQKLVEKKPEQYPAPTRIIIYSSCVREAVQLVQALDCSVFHTTVDNRRGLEKTLRLLISGEQRLIVATNALRLGLDLTDIEPSSIWGNHDENKIILKRVVDLDKTMKAAKPSSSWAKTASCSRWYNTDLPCQAPWRETIWRSS